MRYTVRMHTAASVRRQQVHALREQVLLHVRVIVETLVASVTLVLIAAGIYFFVTGSQIISSNVERMGVRLQRTVHANETYIFGSFVARSDCTHVHVVADTASAIPAIYLSESEPRGCSAYRNPMPYTFTVTLDGAYTGPLAVFMNGDRIATAEEY